MTLRERYAQPWRHFHTWDHIERLQRAVIWYYNKRGIDQRYIPGNINAAILWHDAVYIPGATDNEEKSFELYQLWIDKLKITPSLKNRIFDNLYIKLVKETILATKTHVKHYDVYGHRNIMLSCDLVSLAAPWPQFCLDATNVCKEYAYVYEESKVTQGRLEFYEKMLDRPYIYPHPHFEESHGPRARANLQRALAQGKGIPT